MVVVREQIDFDATAQEFPHQQVVRSRPAAGRLVHPSVAGEPQCAVATRLWSRCHGG